MLASLAISCSLIDPLDGISDGKPRSRRQIEPDLEPAPVDSGGVDTSPRPEPEVDAASPPPDACTEFGNPNDPSPREISSGTRDLTFCGTVTADHPDKFFFDAARRSAYALVISFVDGTPDAVIEVKGPDRSESGHSIDFGVNPAAGGAVYITIRTPQSQPQQYQLRLIRS